MNRTPATEEKGPEHMNIVSAGPVIRVLTHNAEIARWRPRFQVAVQTWRPLALMSGRAALRVHDKPGARERIKPLMRFIHPDALPRPDTPMAL